MELWMKLDCSLASFNRAATFVGVIHGDGHGTDGSSTLRDRVQGHRLDEGCQPCLHR
jgi:hypothetical protein